MADTMQYEDYVDYDLLDAFKRKSMKMAEKTKKRMERLGFEEISWSRGESCYLFRHKESGLIQGCVIEGLGTKSCIAEDPDLRKAFGGRSFYDVIAIDNVRMALNDMITLGVIPYLYMSHPAVEDATHLADLNGDDLIRGTDDALEEDGCTMGPGETPVLKDVITPGRICLSGAGIGVLRKNEHLMCPDYVKPGMRILFFPSSGVHANAITMMRRLAARLKDGYLTDIGDGRTYGEALLVPTQGYVKLIETCQDTGVKMAYAVNITGHGFAKIMRARQPLTYVIERVPKLSRIFEFIMKNGPVTLRNMYNSCNMGAGLAVFVEPDQAPKALHVGDCLKVHGYDAGYVAEGDRKVVLAQYPDMEPFTKLDLR